jgi:hypothetical protein
VRGVRSRATEPTHQSSELARILQAKGLPKADAQRTAAQIMPDKRGALYTLVREELGIDPAELGAGSGVRGSCLNQTAWSHDGCTRTRRIPSDDTLLILQRFAIYIVISMPNRKSIARGVSHFIRISYVYRTIRRRS